MRKSSGNYQIFMMEVERKVNHYCGDHTICKGCKKVEHPILNVNSQIAFKVCNSFFKIIFSRKLGWTLQKLMISINLEKVPIV